MAFCGAEIRPGFEVVAERIGLELAVSATDVVITGEGRLDAQTLHGKAPAGVARLARRLGKQCYAIVGEIDDTGDFQGLFDSVVAAKPVEMSSHEAIRNAAALLRACARRLGASIR